MSQSQTIQVSNFYKFFPIDESLLGDIQSLMEKKAQGKGLQGLFILGTEGVNSTYSGPPESVEKYKKDLISIFGQELNFKDSFTHKHPFLEFKVKVRPEIVTLGTPDLVPNGEKDRHLSPEDWQKTLEEEDVVLLDTRNDYELEVGKFKGAIDPHIKEFTEFPGYLEKSGIDKDKKVLIYCTGGIRCEKAILEMDRQGFKNVYQLDGGILNYIEKFPNKNWEGDCFVFDYRVAVDQNLNRSEKWVICPHCGQPGKTKITCKHCKQEETVCDPCLEKGDQYRTCSKNCEHHYRLGHEFRNVHQDAVRKRNVY